MSFLRPCKCRVLFFIFKILAQKKSLRRQGTEFSSVLDQLAVFFILPLSAKLQIQGCFLFITIHIFCIIAHMRNSLELSFAPYTSDQKQQKTTAVSPWLNAKAKIKYTKIHRATGVNPCESTFKNRFTMCQESAIFGGDESARKENQSQLIEKLYWLSIMDYRKNNIYRYKTISDGMF
jgi:hypothetical protein